MQMIFLCINSSFLFSSLIVDQLMKFLICKLNVLRETILILTSLRIISFFSKFCSTEKKLTQPKYLDGYSEYE